MITLLTIIGIVFAMWFALSLIWNHPVGCLICLVLGLLAFAFIGA